METKVVYYMEENAKSDVPYLIRLPPSTTTNNNNTVTLGDLKRALSSSLSSTRNYKFYFQMHEEGVGNVRVEIVDESAVLPRQGETITCWLIAKDVTSSESASSNNENIDTNGRVNGGMNSKKTMSSKQLSAGGNSNNNMQQYQQQQHQMIYDSMEIGRRGSFKPAGRTTPLKDLNCDELNLTETDSLTHAFDHLRMNRAGSMKSNMNINNNPSIKRPSKPQQFNSFNNHVIAKPPARQLSLDPKQGGGRHSVQKHPPPLPFIDPFDDTATSTSDGDDSSITTLMHHHQHRRHYLIDSKTTAHDTIDDDETTALTQTDFTQTNTQSILSSELDDPTTTFFDTENDDFADDDSQFSSITTTDVGVNKKSSRGHAAAAARKKTKLHSYMRHDSLHSSMTSLADSTMSLNIITVTLDMSANSCLGITIVGQSNKGGGDGGIYVGSITKNGAVELDGRIEAGDMILQVNDISLETLSNEEAVAALREAAMKPDPLKLVVAKCWSADPKGYFRVSKNEPVRPIDPCAWVAHTNAHTTDKESNNYGSYGNYHPAAALVGQRRGHRMTKSISSFGSSSSLDSTLPPDDTLEFSDYPDNYNYQHQPPYNPYRQQQQHHIQQQQNTITSNTMDLTQDSDMETVVRHMAMVDSGLDVGTHDWLKLKLNNTFMGSTVVDWLYNHVEGFPDKKDARGYASQLLKQGYIRNAVGPINKRFSQRCLYQFGDLNGSTLLGVTTAGAAGVGPNTAATLAPVHEESETEIDSVSEYNERNNYYVPHHHQHHQRQMMMSGGAGNNNKLVNQPPYSQPGTYQQIKSVGSNNYATTTSQQNMMFMNTNNKIYASHMNSGLGGPPPPPSYVSSSSSSNATSSTATSNNTTSQTIGTAIGHGSSNKKDYQRMHVSSNPAACQFYFAPPQPPASQPPPHANLHLTSYTNDDTQMTMNNNNSTQLGVGGASSMFYQTDTTLSQTMGGGSSFSSQLTASQQTSNNSTTIEGAGSAGGQSGVNPPNSMISHFDTTTGSSQSGASVNNNSSGFKYITSHFKLGGGGGGGGSNRSSKSSDASSSGHGSDMELLSSSKSRFSMKRKQQSVTNGNVFYQQQQQQVVLSTNSSNKSSNYYEINKLVQQQQQQSSKPLDKVSREHRISKQSFLKAMDNPCNIIDAI